MVGQGKNKPMLMSQPLEGKTRQVIWDKVEDKTNIQNNTKQRVEAKH